MVTHRSPSPPPAGAREEGWVPLVLESERLRAARLESIRWAAGIVAVGAMNGSFLLLFLVEPLGRPQGPPLERMTFLVAALVSHFTVLALMRRWSESRSASAAGFALAAATTVLVSTAATVLMFRALHPGPGGPGLSWWLGDPGPVPPMIGPDAVAAWRPALVILLLLVLPPLMATIDTVLAHRDRRHLERLEDEVRLARPAAAGPRAR